MMAIVFLGEFPIPVPDDCRGRAGGESGSWLWLQEHASQGIATADSEGRPTGAGISEHGVLLPAGPMLITQRYAEMSREFPIPVPDDR